jgi:predicted nucleic acid-binding protein
MKIYLDACSLQRPLDDRSQPRINIEAEAILTILRLVEAGALELFSSETLAFEINRISNPYRKLQAAKILTLARDVIELDEAIESQAAGFIKAGIKPLDALHLASASCKKVDYFCTCDDRLLKKSRKLDKLGTEVVSPLQLVAEVAP